MRLFLHAYSRRVQPALKKLFKSRNFDAVLEIHPEKKSHVFCERCSFVFFSPDIEWFVWDA